MTTTTEIRIGAVRHQPLGDGTARRFTAAEFREHARELRPGWLHSAPRPAAVHYRVTAAGNDAVTTADKTRGTPV